MLWRIFFYFFLAFTIVKLGSSISILSKKLDIFLNSIGAVGSFDWPRFFLWVSNWDEPVISGSVDHSPLGRSPSFLFFPLFTSNVGGQLDLWCFSLEVLLFGRRIWSILFSLHCQFQTFLILLKFHGWLFSVVPGNLTTRLHLTVPVFQWAQCICFLVYFLFIGSVCHSLLHYTSIRLCFHIGFHNLTIFWEGYNSCVFYLHYFFFLFIQTTRGGSYGNSNISSVPHSYSVWDRFFSLHLPETCSPLHILVVPKFLAFETL